MLDSFGMTIAFTQIVYFLYDILKLERYGLYRGGHWGYAIPQFFPPIFANLQTEIGNFRYPQGS